MAKQVHESITKCVSVLVRPFLKLCLKYSLSVQDIIEIIKSEYVDLAAQEIKRHDDEVTVSRISAMIGLHRRDVTRFTRGDGELKVSISVARKVIGQWLEDPRFLTGSGRPRVLSVDGPDSDFKQLVHTIATDLQPATVLFELERSGSIGRVKGGIKLQSAGYENRRVPLEGFQLLADDVEDLVELVDENIFGDAELPQLHAKTVYDNIAVENVPEIREWLLEQGAAFHKKARRFLAKFDLDVRKRGGNSPGGVRVAVGTFSRVSEETVADEAGIAQAS